MSKDVFSCVIDLQTRSVAIITNDNRYCLELFGYFFDQTFPEFPLHVKEKIIEAINIKRKKKFSINSDARSIQYAVHKRTNDLTFDIPNASFFRRVLPIATEYVQFGHNLEEKECALLVERGFQFSKKIFVDGPYVITESFQKRTDYEEPLTWRISTSHLLNLYRSKRTGIYARGNDRFKTFDDLLCALGHKRADL